MTPQETLPEGPKEGIREVFQRLYWDRFRRVRRSPETDHHDTARQTARQTARTIVLEAGVMRQPTDDEPPLTKTWDEPPAPTYFPKDAAE